MIPIIYQIVIPFILSAIIVIGVTVIAEKFGTKVGGILGTLPHIIIIAFIFIALNKGTDFASRSAAVVPAEMGINVLFLLLFAHFSHRSSRVAIFSSLVIWTALSTILVLVEFHNIFIAIAIYLISCSFTVIVLEKMKKVRSRGKVKVHYTFSKLVSRGIMAGAVISFAVLMSNIGSVISGIFSVFPAMFLSTMVISLREHDPGFVEGLAKSMVFGTPSVTSYAVAIHFLYPEAGLVFGTIISFQISVIIAMLILSIRDRIL